MNIKVKYMGLELEHPIIIGAGPLTRNAEAVSRCAEAGASAVVLPSLFEEQISRETADLNDTLHHQEFMHAEVFEYLEARIDMRYGTRNYLETISQARNAVDIPVIASLNCVSTKYWSEFAQEIEAAGASALELNIGIMPGRRQTSGREVEEQVLAIVAAARAAVKMPLAVKIGPQFSSLPDMVARIAAAGANACVLFNRFWPPTINLQRESVEIGSTHSANAELGPVLRAVAQMADATTAQICANTGIHSGQDVARTILAGAVCAQVVSAPLQNGLEVIGQMRRQLADWMKQHQYNNIEDFRGKLSQARNPEHNLFSRLQYMTALGRKR